MLKSFVSVAVTSTTVISVVVEVAETAVAATKGKTSSSVSVFG